MNALPADFVKMLMRLPGHEDLPEALVSTQSPVSVRLNPFKPTAHMFDAVSKTVPWDENGLYLDSRPNFTLNTALYDGRFYVQDASSMMVADAVKRIVERIGARPLNYLDTCAAPGGKTLGALSYLPEGSFVLANEFDSQRVNALCDNLHRWGVPGYAVSRTDARNLHRIGQLFDIVAADVPCSGEGMMRKNPTAISQWSPELINQCATLQREIIQSVWTTLRPGGYLIYSTCTFNLAENEENVRWMVEHLGAEAVDLGLNQYPGVLPGIDTDIPCVRMLPGRVDGEGQFVAVVRKPGINERFPLRNSQVSKSIALPRWLKEEFLGVSNPVGNIYAVMPDHKAIITHLQNTVGLIEPGVAVGVPKGRDLMPAHALATSLILNAEAFPVADVDYETAINYLTGNVLKLPGDIPRGFVLIAQDGRHLGWVKNIGSRANNLFPAPLRIKSRFTA